MAASGRPRHAAEPVWLDYGRAASPDLLRNLSAVTTAGRYLWTASDETRTVECLEPDGDGFRLKQQFTLDDLFPSLPGAPDGAEADIESIDASDGRLWICGSHCRVRRKTGDPGLIASRFRGRPSRRLLGSASLTDKGGALAAPGDALPFKGARSLRARLRENAFIAPFVNLPSKENGLDIEGLSVVGKRLYFGLRGPLADSFAIVIEGALDGHASVADGALTTHLLNLDGLGVRDLARAGRDLIVLAGPVSSAHGPFALFRWRPARKARVQQPVRLVQWLSESEYPEGICSFERHRSPGLLLIVDSPDGSRIKKSRYRADWFPLPE